MDGWGGGAERLFHCGCSMTLDQLGYLRRIYIFKYVVVIVYYCPDARRFSASHSIISCSPPKKIYQNHGGDHKFDSKKS